jgi:hypothetical protein
MVRKLVPQKVKPQICGLNNLFVLRTFYKCGALRICNLRTQSCSVLRLKTSASLQIHTFFPYKYSIENKWSNSKLYMTKNRFQMTT